MLAQLVRRFRARNIAKSLSLRAGVASGHAASAAEVVELLRRLRPLGVDLIRVGGTGDGGYLVPNDLDGLKACFSPGVATTATFEEEMIKRGIPCFLLDASVEKAPITHDLITFEPKFLSTIDDEKYRTLDRWVEESAPEAGDLLLQMDIEGSEWSSLLAASPETLLRFRVIVLEAHDCEMIFDRFGFRIIRDVFEKLLDSFVMVHIHPNNHGGSISNGKVAIPEVLEFTLLRRDRVELVAGSRVVLPHPLDQKNAPEFPDLKLDDVFIY